VSPNKLLGDMSPCLPPGFGAYGLVLCVYSSNTGGHTHVEGDARWWRYTVVVLTVSVSTVVQLTATSSVQCCYFFTHSRRRGALYKVHSGLILRSHCHYCPLQLAFSLCQSTASCWAGLNCTGACLFDRDDLLARFLRQSSTPLPLTICSLLDSRRDTALTL